MFKKKFDEINYVPRKLFNRCYYLAHNIIYDIALYYNQQFGEFVENGRVDPYDAVAVIQETVGYAISYTIKLFEEKYSYPLSLDFDTYLQASTETVLEKLEESVEYDVFDLFSRYTNPGYYDDKYDENLPDFLINLRNPEGTVNTEQVFAYEFNKYFKVGDYERFIEVNKKKVYDIVDKSFHNAFKLSDFKINRYIKRMDNHIVNNFIDTVI